MNENIFDNLKKLYETLNEKFQKIRFIITILVVSIFFINALIGFSSFNSGFSNKNNTLGINYKNNNIFSFLSGQPPKEDPNYIPLTERKAGDLYGAHISDKKGPIGFIQNYIEIYKIKKGIDHDYIQTNKELDKYYNSSDK